MEKKPGFPFQPYPQKDFIAHQQNKKHGSQNLIRRWNGCMGDNRIIRQKGAKASEQHALPKTMKSVPGAIPAFSLPWQKTKQKRVSTNHHRRTTAFAPFSLLITTRNTTALLSQKKNKSNEAFHSTLRRPTKRQPNASTPTPPPLSANAS